MKLAVAFGLALTAVAFLIPAVIAEKPDGNLTYGDLSLATQSIETDNDNAAQAGIGEEEADAEPSSAVQSVVDSSISIRLLTEDGVTSISLRDYLRGVVAAEMPVTFEPEALKAQAVTARTYTLYRVSRGGAHDGADVCTDSTHCSAYITDAALKEKWGSNFEENIAKIQTAVDETDGMVILYDGELIDAVFHSTSSGQTEAAVDVWGADRAYLQSVQSGGEESAPRFNGSFEISSDELREKLLSAYPDADLSVPEAEWFTDMVRSEAGSVITLNIGGIQTRGSAVRALLNLNSSNFTVTAANGEFFFTTVGYGHGVGMSQYGANAMARNGSTYTEILQHYYTGVAVQLFTEN